MTININRSISMNEFDYNLETLKRALTNISNLNISEKQSNVLKELRCNSKFEQVFGCVYEDKGIITERELSKLTNFKFSTYAVATQHIRDPNVGISDNGEVYILCAPRMGWDVNNYNNQPVTVFMMLDEVPDRAYDNVTEVLFIIDEKIRYTGYFVSHTGFRSKLIEVLKEYVPENVSVVVKK